MDAQTALPKQRSVDVDRSNLVRRFIARRRRALIIMLLIVFLLVVNASSFAQSSISFDPASLINQINVWVPVFLPILGIGLGITIAIALIEKVGSSILKAFKS
jgi:hypothetical protein